MKLCAETTYWSSFVSFATSGKKTFLIVPNGDSVPSGYTLVADSEVYNDVDIEKWHMLLGASDTYREGDRADGYKTFLAKYYIDSTEYNIDYKVIRDAIKKSIQVVGRNETISTENTPPVSPSLNDLYLVGTSPTGAFVGHANEIAKCTQEDPVTWSFHSQEEIGFDQLNDTQKNIACFHKVPTPAQMKTFLDYAVYLQYMGFYGLNCCSIARPDRLAQMKLEFWGRVGKAEGETVWTEGNLAFDNYRDMGTDGTTLGDGEVGPADYIYGTTGTIYESTNLIGHSSWSADGFDTWSDFCDYVYAKVILGQYLF